MKTIFLVSFVVFLCSSTAQASLLENPISEGEDGTEIECLRDDIRVGSSKFILLRDECRITIQMTIYINGEPINISFDVTDPDSCQGAWDYIDSIVDLLLPPKE